MIAFTEPVEPKRGKNPMHLDLRVAPGQDYEAELARLRRGGRALGCRLISRAGRQLVTRISDPLRGGRHLHVGRGPARANALQV